MASTMKFKVFENIAFVLSHFGMYPQRLAGAHSVIKLLLGGHVLFVIFGGFLISSSLFVYKNVHNFELVLETISIVIAGIQIGGMVLSIRFNLDRVADVHFAFQDIVDTSTATRWYFFSEFFFIELNLIFIR